MVEEFTAHSHEAAALAGAAKPVSDVADLSNPYADLTEDADVVEVSAPRRSFSMFRRSRAAVIALVAASSGVAMAVASDAPETASAVAANYALGDSEGLLVPTAAPEPSESAAVSESAGPAFAYNVKVDGKEISSTARLDQTLAEALADEGITVDKDDIVSAPLDEPVRESLDVSIVRVESTRVVESYTDKYTSTEKKTDDLYKGETKVETKGVDGKGTRTFDVVTKDGKETSRTLVIETVETKRVNEVKLVGTATRPTYSAPSTSSSSSSSSYSAPVASGPVAKGSSKAIAQSMLASYGWGMDQWPYLEKLWQRESGWNHLAMNRSSGAYGIPQSLPGSMMASAGADWRTNPATQIKWGMGYIKGRYGSPAGAWAHSQRTGWY